MKPYLFLIFLFFLIASCTSSPSEVSNDPIEIGMVVPLTGGAALWGEQTKNGGEMAMREINLQGGINGRMVRLAIEDSAAEPKTAVNAISKLITVNGVSAVVGDIASGPTLAMAPVAEQNQVVLLSSCASNAKIKFAGDYIFRVWPSDAGQSSMLARVFSERGYRTAAVFFVNNDYGSGLKDGFIEEFARLGGVTLVSESWEQDATDVRTQIVKLQEKGVDAVFIAGYPVDVAVAVRQMRQMGFDMPVFLSDTGDGSDFAESVGEAKEGVMYAKISGVTDASFVESYTSQYGVPPELCAAEGYDAVWLIAKSIEEGGDDGASIQKTLSKVGNGYPGASGTITFDEYGEVMKTYDLWVWKNGVRTLIS